MYLLANHLLYLITLKPQNIFVCFLTHYRLKTTDILTNPHQQSDSLDINVLCCCISNDLPGLTNIQV